MRTSFPNLPFPDYGEPYLEPGAPHSAATASPRAHPRTDLQTLQPWTSFCDDIHAVIKSALKNCPPQSNQFSIRVPGPETSRPVATEEELRFHAIYTLHDPVQQVLKKLGVKGRFIVSGAGNPAVLGDPDMSWAVDPRDLPHPKLVVEYKPWWIADLLDILAAFSGTRSGRLSMQSVEALQQVYGYMTFNHTKFGILTNWKRALFLHRVETPARKTLEFHLVELDGNPQSPSMLKAFVAMVLLAEADSFYVSPATSSVSPAQSFGSSASAQKQRRIAVKNARGFNMQPCNGQYDCIPLDFRLCHFNLSSARRRGNACIVKTFLVRDPGTPDLPVVCKVIDAVRYPDEADILREEASCYASLEALQGIAIPTLYGFYEVWGILQFLALAPVGDPILDDEIITQALQRKMKATLRRVHDAGFIHGDIDRRNFCRTKDGDVFLVDLEMCRPPKSMFELDDEMAEVDAL